MRRRDFIRVLAGGVALAMPISVRSQQVGKPVIGYLSVQAIAARKRYIEAFRSGLASEGFIEGQNLTIEYRAGSRPELLSELAADLVRHQVAVIATSGGPPAAFAAKRATETIPIVFASGGDPVQLGLVSSFNRPDKNLTGIYFQLAELVAKRLALLRELLPAGISDVCPRRASDAASVVAFNRSVTVAFGHSRKHLAEGVRNPARAYPRPTPLARNCPAWRRSARASRFAVAGRWRLAARSARTFSSAAACADCSAVVEPAGLPSRSTRAAPRATARRYPVLWQ